MKDFLKKVMLGLFALSLTTAAVGAGDHGTAEEAIAMVKKATAYMKANYPALYMAAVLTADSGDVDKVSESITECTRMGITVLPPDINESVSDFTAITTEDGGHKIRFGLRSIKNFGEGIGKKWKIYFACEFSRTYT